MAANDRQVGGEHYKTTEGIVEHWDIVAQHSLDYFQGQITKYVMRWRKKGGLQDLQKARHFLDKYIEVETEKTNPNVAQGTSSLEEYQRLAKQKDPVGDIWDGRPTPTPPF
jgi:hypothetical protein